MPEHGWMSLSMSENAWINYADYIKVLNMPQYSYNNIIIFVTVIILEFLSAAILSFLTQVRT